MIVVVDIGLGNVASVANMLRRAGHEASILREPGNCSEVDRYILPGVGAFDTGAKLLRETGWHGHLVNLPTSTHILGICLGMQLLGISSEEGVATGLGRVAAHFRRLDDSIGRVPHIGWSCLIDTDDHLFDPAVGPPKFYFTHSYYAECMRPDDVTARTPFGGVDFISAYRCGNTRGVQFHPEKSHKYGLSVLDRFARL